MEFLGFGFSKELNLQSCFTLIVNSINTSYILGDIRDTSASGNFVGAWTYSSCFAWAAWAFVAFIAFNSSWEVVSSHNS